MTFRSGLGLRLALIADLWVYLIFVVLFVLIPIFPTLNGGPNNLTPPEILVAILSIIPAYGLAGRLLERPHLWGNEWAYLSTSGYGLLVLAVFLTVGRSQVNVEPDVIPIVVASFFTGIIGAAGAHVFDGGSRPNQPIMERWLRDHEKDSDVGR